MIRIRIMLMVSLLMYHFSAFASEANHNQSRHQIQTKFALGSISNEAMDLDSRYIELAYNYEFADRWYVGVGLLRGDSDVLLSVNSLFNDIGFDFEAAKLRAGYKYRASLKHQLYAEVSLSSSAVRISSHAMMDETSRDIGFGYSTGWRYLLNERFSINIGLENHQFGDEFKNKSIVTGLAINF